MPTAHYGATADGVRALIPDTPVTDRKTPTTTDVEGWLDTWDARVRRKVGDLTGFDDELAVDFAAIAADVVHHFVASIAEDAGHPERLANDNRYAKVLWDRAESLFTQLVGDVDEARGEEGVADTEAPAGSFPEPIAWLDLAT
jgi:uncharacterized protein YjbJ (UPF0337 family)